MKNEERITNEDRRTEDGRRVLHKRKRLDPNYKGWQRRNMPNQRSSEKRRNSE